MEVRDKGHFYLRIQSYTLQFSGKFVFTWYLAFHSEKWNAENGLTILLKIQDRSILSQKILSSRSSFSEKNMFTR